MEQTKTCEGCGREFVATGYPCEVKKVRYCSRGCWSRTKQIAPTIDLTCAECGRSFTVKASQLAAEPNRRFCSRPCYWKHMLQGEPRKCDHCGAEFYASPAEDRKNRDKGGVGRRFCSRECWRLAHTGKNNPRWSGPKMYICQNCLTVFERPSTNPKHMRFCSLRCKGLYLREHPYEHHNYKGGTSKLQDARKDPRYMDWRKAVYKRDDYTCQDCGQRGGRLHAHHLRTWIDHPELRLDVANGRTLCVPCHTAIKGREAEYLECLTATHSSAPALA